MFAIIKVNHNEKEGVVSMDPIEIFLRTQLGVSDEALIRQAMQVICIRELKKGECLVRQGECLTDLCFLIKGVVRGFLLDYQGNEMTDCFGFKPGQGLLPSPDFSIQSLITIQAEEDCQIIAIPVQMVQFLIHNSLEVSRIYNRMLIEYYRTNWEWKIAFRQYNAAQRYEWFLREYEGLIDRVPHVHIASFLGISPVTLSRLRGKLTGQKKDIL